MEKNIVSLLVLLFVAMGFNGISKSTNDLFNCNITINFKNSTIKDGEVFYLNKNLLDNSCVIIDSCVKKNNKIFFSQKVKEPFTAVISSKENGRILSPPFVVFKDDVFIDWIDYDYEDIYPQNLSKAIGGEGSFIKQYARSFNIENERIRYIHNQLSQFGDLNIKSPNYDYFSNYEKNIYDWIVKNNDKYYTISKLYFVRGELSNKTLLMSLESLKNNFGDTTIYSVLTNYVKTRQTSQIGGQFIDIELIDNMQRNVKSKDVFLPNKELYIVDFGASWCGYCILQAREINENYSSIDTTKMQIISISIDQKINDWLKFEKREKFKWKSYMVNGKLDKDNVRSLFSIVPAYFILDSKKNIIAKYDALDSIPFLKFKQNIKIKNN